MNHYLGYRCTFCDTEISPTEILYTCPACGGNLDVVLDYRRIQQKYRPEDIFSRAEGSLWRYEPLLPVTDPGGLATPLHAAGWTPVYQPERLIRGLGLRKFWLKDEGKNPTASFKDRASAIVVARSREIGADVVVTASTGNAGAALAGMAAAIEQNAVILAPKTAPAAKIAQLLIYGAQVVLVDGSYDDAFDLTIQASREFGWYCRNTGYNPFTAEGKKTAAFEIWEQVLRHFRAGNKPLCVFVSVGDGNIISGLHKGFKDLMALGWLERMPRLFGVQSELSSAVADAYLAGTEVITPVKATTLADSISVNLPRDGGRAVRAAVETEGAYIKVADADIIRAIIDLGAAGIFAEPAGAAALAGLQKALAEGDLLEDDPVLVINSGNGLKDIRAAMMAIPNPAIIEPTMSALKLHLEKKGRIE